MCGLSGTDLQSGGLILVVTNLVLSLKKYHICFFHRKDLLNYLIILAKFGSSVKKIRLLQNLDCFCTRSKL